MNLSAGQAEPDVLPAVKRKGDGHTAGPRAVSSHLEHRQHSRYGTVGRSVGNPALSSWFIPPIPS